MKTIAAAAAVCLSSWACSEPASTGSAADTAQQATDTSAADVGAAQDGDAANQDAEVAQKGGPACDKLEQEINAAIFAAAKAMSPCVADGDCTLVPSSISCKGSCTVSVATTQAAAFKDEKAKLAQKYCVDLGFAQNCWNSIPSCGAVIAKCVQGYCGMGQ